MASTLIFNACKKTDDSTTPPDTKKGSDAVQINLPSDGYGLMAAIQTNVVTIMSIPGMPDPIITTIKIDAAAAYFPTDLGGSTFSDVGTVKLNTFTLDKDASNNYNKVATMLYDTSTGLGISSNARWTVSSISGITNYSVSVPPIYDLDYFGTILGSTKTISKSKGLSFYLSSRLSGAVDSVYVVIVGGAGTGIFKKSYAASTGYVTIPPADLSVLSTGATGQFQITPYKINSTTVSGKKYYFVSENAYVTTPITVE